MKAAFIIVALLYILLVTALGMNSSEPILIVAPMCMLGVFFIPVGIEVFQKKQGNRA